MSIPFITALFPLLLIIPAIMIWALIDLLSRPASTWSDSGQDKLVWALVIVFVGLIGPVIYLTIGRSMLNKNVPNSPSDPAIFS